MRVPTLKMQISANTEYYTSMKFTGEKPTLHQTSHPLAIYKKKGKLTGLSLHFAAKFELHRAFLQNRG